MISMLGLGNEEESGRGCGVRGVPLSVTDLSYQVGRGVPGVHPDTHSVS